MDIDNNNTIHLRFWILPWARAIRALNWFPVFHTFRPYMHLTMWLSSSSSSITSQWPSIKKPQKKVLLTSEFSQQIWPMLRVQAPIILVVSTIYISFLDFTHSEFSNFDHQIFSMQSLESLNRNTLSSSSHRFYTQRLTTKKDSHVHFFSNLSYYLLNHEQFMTNFPT